MQAKGMICRLTVEIVFLFCFLVTICHFKSALLSQQHRKVLDKGKPDDIMPAIKGAKVREN